MSKIQIDVFALETTSKHAEPAALYSTRLQRRAELHPEPLVVQVDHEVVAKVRLLKAAPQRVGVHARHETKAALDARGGDGHREPWLQNSIISDSSFQNGRMRIQ